MSQLLERESVQQSDAGSGASPVPPPATAAAAPAKDARARFPLRGWIALAGIIVLVGLASYAMYGRFFSSADDGKNLVELNPMGRFAAQFGVAQPRVRPDGVRERGTNRYQVKAGEAVLDISKVRNEWAFRYSFDKADLVSPDVQAAMTARFRLTTDSAFAKSLGVTPEQVAKLRAIPARVGMIVNAEDDNRIKQQFDKYLAAPPPRQVEAEALVTLLREVGNRSLPPTRAALAERAAEIRSILTPPQLEPFKPAAR